MSVNVLGGSLEFDAILTTGGLDAAIASIEASLQEVVAKFQKVGDTGTASLDELKKKFAELVAQEKTLSEASANATDPAKVKEYNDKIAETIGQMKQLSAELAKVQQANPVVAPATVPNTPASLVNPDAPEILAKLKAQWEALERQEIKLQSALEKTLNPELIKQYNAALDATIAKMTSLGKEIQVLRTNNPQLSPGQNTPIPAVEPTTSATPTEDPVEPIKRQILAYQQLQLLRNKLASLDKSDPLYKETLAQAVKLQNTIQNVNKALLLAGSNTAGFQAMTGIVRGLVGGFEAWNGVLGLTATQSEAVQQTITKVVSAMGVLNGIQEIATVLDKNSAVNLYLMNALRKEGAVTTEAQAAATEGLAAAQAAEATSTEAAVVAQEELNTAMTANPAAILLATLAGIVLALQAFASNQKDATEEQVRANDAATKAIEIYNKLIDLRGQIERDRAIDANNAVQIAEAQGKSELAVLGLKKEALQTELAANNIAIARQGYDDARFNSEQRHLDDLLQEQHALTELSKREGGLNDYQKARLEGVESEVKVYQAMLGPVTQLFEANKRLDGQLRATTEETNKKIADDQLRSAAANAEAILALAKKNTKEQLDDEIDAIRKRTVIELNNANLTAGERKKILAQEQADILSANRTYQTLLLKDAVDAAQARLAATKKDTEEELDAQLAVIRATAQEQLGQDGILKGKRDQIRAQETDDIQEVERKRSLLILSNQQETLRAQLDLAQQGSAEELALKLQLLEKEAQAEIVSAQGNAAKIQRINADLEKAQADLRKKYALESSQAEVETIIAGINTRLTAVQKGSEDELALKKNLVDREATLDILQAKERISNEQLLQAKILEINAEANLKKRKLDDDYTQRILDNQIRINKSNTAEKNAQLQEIVNNPFATALDKYNAQRQQLQNNLDLARQDIGEIVSRIVLGQGDISKLKVDLSNAESEYARAKADIADFAAKFKQEQIQGLANDVSTLSSSLGTLADSLDETNPRLATMLRGASQLGSVIGSAAAQAASGNYIGAAIAEISGIINILAQAAEKTREAEKEVQDFYTALITGEVEYQELLRQRERQQLELNATTLQGIRDEQSALVKQKGEIQKEIDDLMQQIAKQTYTLDQSLANNNPLGGALGFLTSPITAIASFFGLGNNKSASPKTASLAGLNFDQIEELFTEGRLDDKAKAIFQELQNLKQEGVDIDATLTQLQEKTKEIFTGTTTDNIAQGIIDGFKQGYRSAADFASNFQDLMTNAILSSLEAQTLQPALQDFYNQFADFSASDGVLTSDEVDQLKKVYNDIITNFSNQVDNLQAISGLNLSGASGATNSLAGAIKGITEDQAELLAGQFGGLRITAMDQLNMATRQFQVLQDIQRDTSNLPEMKDILRYFKLNGIKITS